MERLWTKEHGADGLRDKFHVYKPVDRVSIPGCPCPAYRRDSRIGEDGEFVFTMRPETDREAWVALRAYADAVAHRAPQLAADIRKRLRVIEIRNEMAYD